MSQLKDKVIVITGAAGGIGNSAAQLMASRGAHLVLADVVLEPARVHAEELAAAGVQAIAVELDLAFEESCKNLIDTTISHFGRIDVLCNNAADLRMEMAIADTDVERMEVWVWDRTFQVNTRGPFLTCHYALPHMVKQGGGSIVNTTSNLMLQGQVIQAAYSSSKSAVLQMTRAIAASHGRRGIRANTVSPGLTMTRAARKHMPERLMEIVESETLTPFMAEPIDIAYVMAFLASDESRNITGQNLVSDGGTSSHVPGFAHFRPFFQGEE